MGSSSNCYANLTWAPLLHRYVISFHSMESNLVCLFLATVQFVLQLSRTDANCYLMVGLPLHGIQPQGSHTSFLNRSITTSLLLQIQPLKEAYKPFYIRERINYRQYYSEIQDQEEPHHNPTRWTPSAIAKPLTSFSSALQLQVKVVQIFPFDIGDKSITS